MKTINTCILVFAGIGWFLGLLIGLFFSGYMLSFWEILNFWGLVEGFGEEFHGASTGLVLWTALGMAAMMAVFLGFGVGLPVGFVLAFFLFVQASRERRH